MAPEPVTPHPDAHIWAQASTSQNVRSLVPVVLDFKSNVFPKWRTFFSMAVTTYALEDHLTSVTPSTDATWLWLDALVLRWLYGSMAMDLVDLVMPTSTAADAPVATANTMWLAVHGLFNDNKKTREVYLAEEFRNVKQGDLSVGDYLNHQQVTSDALAEVGAPVSNSDLVTNVIKGLDRFHRLYSPRACLLAESFFIRSQAGSSCVIPVLRDLHHLDRLHVFMLRHVLIRSSVHGGYNFPLAACR
jgi:hypothetical protein